MGQNGYPIGVILLAGAWLAGSGAAQQGNPRADDVRPPRPVRPGTAPNARRTRAGTSGGVRATPRQAPERRGLQTVGDRARVRLLGSAKYAMREQAFAELRLRGAKAVDALMEGLQSPDEEVASRCTELLESEGGAARAPLEALIKTSSNARTVARARRVIRRLRGRSWMGVYIRDLQVVRPSLGGVRIQRWAFVQGAWKAAAPGERLPDDEAVRIDVPGRQGVLVIEVIANTPAASAGMKPNDFIIGFNGVPIRNVDELRATVGSTASGIPSEVRIFREGQLRGIPITLGRMPPIDPLTQRLLVRPVFRPPVKAPPSPPKR